MEYITPLPHTHAHALAHSISNTLGTAVHDYPIYQLQGLGDFKVGALVWCDNRNGEISGFDHATGQYTLTFKTWAGKQKIATKLPNKDVIVEIFTKGSIVTNGAEKGVILSSRVETCSHSACTHGTATAAAATTAAATTAAVAARNMVDTILPTMTYTLKYTLKFESGKEIETKLPNEEFNVEESRDLGPQHMDLSRFNGRRVLKATVAGARFV